MAVAGVQWKRSYDRDEIVRRVRCADHEHLLGFDLMRYEQRHAGHYPATLAEAVSPDEFGSSVLVCPDSDDRPAPRPVPPSGRAAPTTQQAIAALAGPGRLSYVYCGHADWIDTGVQPDAVVLYESLANHGNGAWFMFGDGHVDYVAAPRAARLIAAASATTRPVSAATVP